MREVALYLFAKAIMLHPYRRYRVTDVEELSDLAHLLTIRSWPLCRGFRNGAYLFLNDAISDKSANEFAVLLKQPDDRYRQIASFDFGWLDESQAQETVELISRGVYDCFAKYHRALELRIESPALHEVCSLCTRTYLTLEAPNTVLHSAFGNSRV